MAKSSESGGWADSLRLHYAARKRLAQTVRGDEAKAFRASSTGEFGGFMPPIQNEVGGFRHSGICGAERFRVAVAQIFTQLNFAYETADCRR